MSENDKRGLAGWLGLRAPFDYSKARWLGPVLSGLVFLLFILAIASAVRMLGGAVFGGASLTPGNSLGVGAVTVALIGAPFVIWRSVVAQKSVDVQEQGQITDRINKAVEGLGAEKTVKRQRRRQSGKLAYVLDDKGAPDFSQPMMEDLTEPNLEVRIGAIYALERISQDSARDHIQIMEILCAYIRQNAGREDVPLPDGDTTPGEWGVWGLEGRKHPRLDVDVALKVIERRGGTRRQLESEQDPPYQMGLERVPLRKIIISQRNLIGTNLSDADLKGASLWGARLQAVKLTGAELQGANLAHAELERANLSFANLQGVDFGFAELRGANLWHANLRGANLNGAGLGETRVRYTQLQGADLMFANLQEVKLEAARLQGANLESAHLQGALIERSEVDGSTNLSGAFLSSAALRFVDCRQAFQINDHLQSMFGDASVTLPGGHGPESKVWPAHWPTFELSDEQFEEEWRKWQADPDNYTPPEATEEG